MDHNWNPWSWSAAAEVAGNTAPVCMAVHMAVGKWFHTLTSHPTLGEPQGFSWGTLRHKRVHHAYHHLWTFCVTRQTKASWRCMLQSQIERTHLCVFLGWWLSPVHLCTPLGIGSRCHSRSPPCTHGCPPSPPLSGLPFQIPAQWWWAEFLHTLSHVTGWALSLPEYWRWWCWSSCRKMNQEWTAVTMLHSAIHTDSPKLTTGLLRQRTRCFPKRCCVMYNKTSFLPNLSWGDIVASTTNLLSIHRHGVEWTSDGKGGIYDMFVGQEF